MRLLCLLLLGLLLVPAAHTRAADDQARVLILGDSISIGYTPYVKKLMGEEAVVNRPMRGKRAENSAGTNNGIQHIDRWLKIDGGNYDVIHFNFGLHDIKHVADTGKNSNDPEAPHQAEPQQYEKQLRAIVEKLEATGATLIFATTTPVPEGKVSPYRDPADVVRYNKIANKIMQEHEVRINDLFAFAQPRLEQIQRPVNVHFTPAGSEALAGQVVKHIEAALEAREK